MENLSPEQRARAMNIMSNPGKHGSDLETTTDVIIIYDIIIEFSFIMQF